MSRIDKFKGIIPAFYACYDSNGEVSIEQSKKLARYLADKGVQGLYVGAPRANASITVSRSARKL